MEKSDVVAALAALAQDNRLDVFRLLVQAGPAGLAAGEVARRLKLPPNTLSFHFDRLRQAGLVAVRRESPSMIYTAKFDAMRGLVDFLTRNCCAGVSEDGGACAAPAKPASKSRSRKHAHAA